MKLKHFTLLAKNWYKVIGNKYENPEVIWDAVKQVLQADNYLPENKRDCLDIIIHNVTPFIKKDMAVYTMEMLNNIDPRFCSSIGYYTKDHEGSNPKSTLTYDYQTAILYHFLSITKFMTSDITNPLPIPDPKVLPVAMTKEEKVLFERQLAPKAASKAEM